MAARGRLAAESHIVNPANIIPLAQYIDHLKNLDNI